MTVLNTTLRLFKAVVLTKDITYKAEKAKYLIQYQQDLFNKGVFIEPSVLLNSDAKAKQIVDEAIEIFGVDLTKINSSFYKTFEEMQSKSDFELFIDQIMHYGSTYGEIDWLKNHGDIYEPNAIDTDTITELQEFVKSFTIISGITKDELAKKIKTLLQSGIALKSEDVSALLDVIKHYNLAIDFTLVKNKEFQSTLALEFGILPRNFDDFMRVVFQYVTGQPLVIKNNTTRDYFNAMSISQALNIAGMFEKYINQFGLKAVTENVMRYRKYILLIRKRAGKGYTKLFNLILRQSKIDKKPRVKSVMANVISPDVTTDMLKESAENATTFQIIRGLNVISERLATDGETAMMYRIRNGKTWMTNKYLTKNEADLTAKFRILLNILRKRTNKTFEDKVIYAPIEYKLPTSAKTFISDSTPEFTKIHVTGNLKLGIAWDKDADLDLHARTLDGRSLGWNSSYYGGGVYYSGDMTSLNNHGFAAEYYLFDMHDFDNTAVITVNPFNIRTSGESLTFDFIVAGDKKKSKVSSSVMTTFDNVAFTDKSTITSGKSLTLALVERQGDGFDVTLVSSGSTQGVRVPNASTQDMLLEIIERKTTTGIDVHDLAYLHEVPLFTDKESLLDYLNDNKFSLQDDVIDLSFETMTQAKLIDLLGE